MSTPVIIAVIAGISLGVTVIVVLLRGAFQLGKLVNQVNTQDASITTLSGKIDGLEAKHDARFDGLETKYDARFDGLEAKHDARFDALEARFDDLETKYDARFDALETKYDARFDALETRYDARFDALETKYDARFDALTAAINELRAEVQQTNRILVGLANHTHDADGRTVFTIPS